MKALCPLRPRSVSLGWARSARLSECRKIIQVPNWQIFNRDERGVLKMGPPATHARSKSKPKIFSAYWSSSHLALREKPNQSHVARILPIRKDPPPHPAYKICSIGGHWTNWTPLYCKKNNMLTSKHVNSEFLWNKNVWGRVPKNIIHLDVKMNTLLWCM